MRMSCNGCRVLRKGCSNGCSIRPCLQWIKSPDSQAHATLFLAKFYGRAGLLNLINAGPQHLRPAIFKSLLYEACGRIVNPINGSVGLLWSGNWTKCQAAVDAVLAGSPIDGTDATASNRSLSLNACDIRHVAREPSWAASDHNLNQVNNRSRFKRTVSRPKTQFGLAAGSNSVDSDGFLTPGLTRIGVDEFSGLTGHDSLANGNSGEEESMFSVETVEASSLRRAAQQDSAPNLGSQAGDGEVRLELTLGLA
ncbi:hypothetical protein FEM48_Zijuj10G0145100 [Ziziphus jujuba var. spinosa]|uniref:LOB domain-containing protein n=1 Tax=Ziziphus jujuba var. spinosa TaxID=714518 RepID=A0A978UNY1_ZIZJJ|nr:hypothetical protein FEM48_Zijuj10G0145100 [Ziziphus jujuba var. spinosa]